MGESYQWDPKNKNFKELSSFFVIISVWFNYFITTITTETNPACICINYASDSVGCVFAISVLLIQWLVLLYLHYKYNKLLLFAEDYMTVRAALSVHIVLLFLFFQFWNIYAYLILVTINILLYYISIYKNNWLARIYAEVKVMVFLMTYVVLFIYTANVITFCWISWFVEDLETLRIFQLLITALVAYILCRFIPYRLL